MRGFGRYLLKARKAHAFDFVSKIIKVENDRSVFG